MTIIISKNWDEVLIAEAMSEATKKPVRIRPNPQYNTNTISTIER